MLFAALQPNTAIGEPTKGSVPVYEQPNPKCFYALLPGRVWFEVERGEFSRNHPDGFPLYHVIPIRRAEVVSTPVTSRKRSAKVHKSFTIPFPVAAVLYEGRITAAHLEGHVNSFKTNEEMYAVIEDVRVAIYRESKVAVSLGLAWPIYDRIVEAANKLSISVSAAVGALLTHYKQSMEKQHVSAS